MVVPISRLRNSVALINNLVEVLPHLIKAFTTLVRLLQQRALEVLQQRPVVHVVHLPNHLLAICRALNLLPQCRQSLVCFLL